MKSCKAGRISYQAIEGAHRIISREFQKIGQIGKCPIATWKNIQTTLSSLLNLDGNKTRI